MLRIGNGKPRLLVDLGDSHHPHKPQYTVPYWGWCGLERWNDICAFQNPHVHEQAGTAVRVLYLQYALKLSGGSTVWQMNLIQSNLKDYIRICIILGEENYVRWTWFDANVKHRFYSLLASVRNRLGV